VRGGFEEFEFALAGGGGSAGEQGGHLGLVEGLEGACGFEGLIEDMYAGEVSNGEPADRSAQRVYFAAPLTTPQ